MDPSNIELPLDDSHREWRARRRMERQGFVGWVLFNAKTGIVLHLYRTLAAAEEAKPIQEAFHGLAFRSLGVHAGGRAYEHIEGRATVPARLASGEIVGVPLRRGHIEARRLPRHLRAARSSSRAS